VQDRQDINAISTQAIDNPVIPFKHFPDLRLSVFWHNSASTGLVCETIATLDQLMNPSFGIGWLIKCDKFQYVF